MVYLYPHPYPVLPDSSDDDQDVAESSSQALKRQASPSRETRRSKKRGKTGRITREGDVVLLLPIVDEGLVAGQWGDEVPDGGRLGKAWWDGIEVDVAARDRDEDANGLANGDAADGDVQKREGKADGDDEMAGENGDVKQDEDIEDGEIPESPSPSTSAATILPPPPRHSTPPPNSSTKPTTDVNGVPILTKKHYHPKVIALAKKIAAKRGVKLVVDPDARRLYETTTSAGGESSRRVEGDVKAEHSALPQKPMDGRTTDRTDSGIFLPEQSRTPFGDREDTESVGYTETSPSTPRSAAQQFASSSTNILPPPPSSATTTTSQHPLAPLGQGRRGRARGRGTGRWAGHWQAKAAAAAAREARAAQLLARGIAPSPAPGAGGGSQAGGMAGGEGREEGPEAEKIRKKEVAVALGSSSWWNHLLIEARKARGPQWDDNTEMYQVDRGSGLYYQSTRSPPRSPPPAAAPPIVPVVDEPTVETRRTSRPDASPRLQIQGRPTSSSGRKSMGPPAIPSVGNAPTGLVPSPLDARKQSLPRASQTPAALPTGLPEPSPTANRVSTSPMLMTNRQVPTPAGRGSVQGYFGEVQRSVSGLGQGGPSQPPVHGDPGVDQEALAQARLQQQHLLQRQMLAAQQAQQASQGQGPGGFGSPGMNPGSNATNNANPSTGTPLGFPANMNPAAAAFLRQQGMNPQQMAALNMLAAQQRAQQAQATGTSSGSPMGTQPGMQQSPGMAQLGMMGLNPQQQQQLANRLPPHMIAQLQQQGGFPHTPNTGGAGGAGSSGMTPEQARAIMNMQQALRMQQQQAQQTQGQGQGQGQGQQGQHGMPGQQGLVSQAGINPAMMAQFLQNAGGGMQGMQGMGQR